MSVSVLDFIPSTEHAAIEGRTSSLDVALYVQAAVDAVHADGGGTLYCPAGTYWLGATINIPSDPSNVDAPANVSIVGDGQPGGTAFVINHSAHAFRSEFAINAFNQAFIYLRDFSIGCVDPNASTGAAYYDQGGSYIGLERIYVYGMKHGFILDQSEQVDINQCHFLELKGHGVWLVRGPDLNQYHVAGQYTNRISIRGCDFNQMVGWGILDDGGLAHTFQDNNFNGGTGHIRIAGFYTGVNIIGGEYEQASGPNILISGETLSGLIVDQRPENVSILGGHFSVYAANNAIKVESVGALKVEGATLSCLGAAIGGSDNASSVFTSGNSVVGGGTLFDTTRAPVHFWGEGCRLFSFPKTLPIIAKGAQLQDVLYDSYVDAGDHVQVSFETSMGVVPFSLTADSEPGAIRLTYQNLSGSGAGGHVGTLWFRITKR